MKGEFDADDFDSFAGSRRSTRDFLPKPVPDEIIEEIIAAGLTSPSWSNTRPFVVAVAKGDVRDRLSDCLLYTSPSPRDVEESRMPSSA